MTLTLERLGNPICAYDAGKTDLDNYRYRVHFVDKDGISVTGDIMHGKRISCYFKNGKPRKRYKVLSEWAIVHDLQFTVYDRSFVYHPEFNVSDYDFSKQGILDAINKMSEVKYDELQFV